jgi:hypothetical protein
MANEPATREELAEIAQGLRQYAKRINPYGPLPNFAVDSSRNAPQVDGDLMGIAQQLELAAQQISRYLHGSR